MFCCPVSEIWVALIVNIKSVKKKIINLNCEKTQKLKLLRQKNSQAQIVTKLNNSSCERKKKTKKEVKF